MAEHYSDGHKRRRMVLDLPDHLVAVVAQKLVHIQDYIRLGAVCKLWRSVYTEIQGNIRSQLPVLMPAYENIVTRSFYNLGDNKVYSSEFPPLERRQCVGSSSHGWLVTIFDDNEVSLVNPFLYANNVIHLPSLKKFFSSDEIDEGYGISILEKAVLSENPASNPNNVVMLIYGDFKRLAFYKAGDNGWTGLAGVEYEMVRDVVYYKDLFYFVNISGEVFSCDFNNRHYPKVIKIIKRNFNNGTYLVESNGDLLLIERKYEEVQCKDLCYNSTFGFSVFKMDWNDLKWIEKKSLDGQMVFVGAYCSLSSVPASDFPGCKPNLIYYTDDHLARYYIEEEIGNGPLDMGVFNLEDGNLQPIESNNNIPESPIWVVPTPQVRNGSGTRPSLLLQVQCC